MQDMMVKAAFVAMNVKTGKTVMQFELDPEDIGMMPELAKAVGELVMLGVCHARCASWAGRASARRANREDS